jgi:WD40 repeat protein
MSDAPTTWLGRLRRPLVLALAVVFYLGLAAALGIWWLWPPQPYVVLADSESAKPWDGDGRFGTALPGPSTAGSVNRIEFSADGGLAAGIKDDQVLVWETATGRLRFTLAAGPSVTALLFSPDNRHLTSRGDQLKLFDLATGDERPLALANADVSPSAFSPDVKSLLVTAGDGNDSLVDLATGAQWFIPLKTPLAERVRPGFVGDWRAVPRGLAYRFSPDGRWLACEELGTLRIFNTATHEEPAAYPGALGQLAFAPDGETWAVAAGNDVRLCAAPSGEERGLLRGHESPVTFLAWSPDGKRLASVAEGEIKLWDLGRQQELATLSPDRPAGVRFSPDGRFLCVAGPGFDRQHGALFAPGEMVPLWDLSASPPRHVASVSGEKVVSPDGGAVAMIGDPDVPVDPWTIARRVPLSTWAVAAGDDHPFFTPDGKMVILAGHTTTVRGKLGSWLARGAADGNGYQYKWVDVGTWRVRAVLDTDAPGVLSSDGRLLATGGGDKSVQLWRVPPRRPAGPSLVLLGLSAVLAAAIVRRRRGRQTENAAADSGDIG